MAPHTPAFPSSQIPQQILLNHKGKRRKDLPQDFDLKRDCKLETMLQYRCEPVQVGSRTEVHCQSVERLFRR